MEKLNFLSDFCFHKERAWSGTTHSFYNALKKYYTRRLRKNVKIK